MLKVRDAKNVVSNHSHGVRWGDEEAMFTKDHVLVLESRKRSLRPKEMSFEAAFLYYIYSCNV